MSPVYATLALLATLAVTPPPTPDWRDRFIVFCYHDIPTTAGAGRDAVDVRSFIEQLEFMRGHGAHFVSVDDILAAKAGTRALPAQAVLLTFDDGCSTFYRNVFPLLRAYQVPAVLSVVTSWPGGTINADCQDGSLMSWQELSEVAHSGLVEVASHTHSMHAAIVMNPQGNTGAAVTTRLYSAERHTYETEGQYRQRLASDLGKSAAMIAQQVGRPPRVLVWPYGEYNRLAIEEAHKLGFEIMLTAEDGFDGGLGDLAKLDEVPRWMLLDHSPIDQFARYYWAGGVVPHPPRVITRSGVHADLDMLYDPDPEAQSRNLDRFVERLVALKPATVYLQAFCDFAGSGVVSQVYFPNRVLPMKADLFGHVARALRLHGIRVYAWMPTLSVVFADRRETESLRVRRFASKGRAGSTAPTRGSYLRLSPFSDAAREKVALLYEDLAINAPLSGILFQDDAYLDEDEDYSPAARAALELAVGRPSAAAPSTLSAAERRVWTSLKTQKLIDWTQALMTAVHRYRPFAKAARTLYAPVLIEPESETWFAQNYQQSLAAYDEVVVLAYPLMENADDATAWLRSLVQAARRDPRGLDKTVFKVQTVDWKNGGRCVPTGAVRDWLRALLTAGAKHIAYYPDNLFDDCPRQSEIRELISTEEFPFTKPVNEQ